MKRRPIRKTKHAGDPQAGRNRVLHNPNQLTPEMLWQQQRLAEIVSDNPTVQRGNFAAPPAFPPFDTQVLIEYSPTVFRTYGAGEAVYNGDMYLSQAGKFVTVDVTSGLDPLPAVVGTTVTGSAGAGYRSASAVDPDNGVYFYEGGVSTRKFSLVTGADTFAAKSAPEGVGALGRAMPIVFHSGKVYGYFSDTAATVMRIYEYDPGGDAWTAKSSSGEAFDDDVPISALDATSRVYVFEDSDVLAYNPAGDSYAAVGTTYPAGISSAANIRPIPHPDGSARFLVFSDHTDGSGASPWWLWDVSGDSWSRISGPTGDPGAHSWTRSWASRSFGYDATSGDIWVHSNTEGFLYNLSGA